MPRAVAVLALVPLLAVFLWLPFEWRWGSLLEGVGMASVVALVLLYPGICGLVAARTGRPTLTVLLATMLFTLPVAVSVLWQEIDATLAGPGIDWPSRAEAVLLGIIALGAFAGGWIASREVRSGRVLRAFFLGGLATVAILSIALMQVLLVQTGRPVG